MTNEKFIGFTMEKTKHIALVAHDGKKKELVEWCDRNKDVLKNHFLCGTGTTAKLIAEKTGLPILYTTVRRDLLEKVDAKGRILYPVDIYVKTPWQ